MNICNWVKITLRSTIRRVMQFFLPELRILEGHGNEYVLYSWNAGSVISPKAKLYPVYQVIDSMIGDYTYIARNSYVQKTEIGKFCSIGPNFLCGWGIHPLNGISTSPCFYSLSKQNGYTFSCENKIEEMKRIKIGNDVFIGANVTILDGVTIGDGAVIGAGAVVSKDIPPYAIAVGCPIQIKRYRFAKDEIDKFLSMKWWDFDEERLKDVESFFFDIRGFLEKNWACKDKSRT